MNRKARRLARLFLALAALTLTAAVPALAAEPGDSSAGPTLSNPRQASMDLAAAYQAIFAPQVEPAAPAAVPEPLPLVVPPGNVACCRPFPACCSTAASEDACNDIGGYTYPTTQQCARNCC